ncbi:MAG TPA: DDE-type integrase/transposase/recombinase [Polyangiaceae bacterium]
MSLKMEFVRRATGPNANVSVLCREFNIARETGHKWRKRFKQQGYDGLEERSRRPRNTPLATAEDLVVAIVESREAHPTWGPYKRHVGLQRRFGASTERTVARVLSRFDKIRQRKRRPPVHVVTQAPNVVVTAPNDVWTVDYKGWWRAQNGERCEPLTVRDAYSRFVLATRVLSGTNTLDARAVFEGLFKRNGLPKMIQCDNGTPFVSVRARAGLSALSAWWVSLGIEVIRSRPGCPQDNGAHERMHSDIAKEIQVVPCGARDSQQCACDKWRHEFNHVRPHGALKDKTPAEVYKTSERRMCARMAMYPSALPSRLAC